MLDFVKIALSDTLLFSICFSVFFMAFFLGTYGKIMSKVFPSLHSTLSLTLWLLTSIYGKMTARLLSPTRMAPLNSRLRLDFCPRQDISQSNATSKTHINIFSLKGLFPLCVDTLHVLALARNMRVTTSPSPSVPAFSLSPNPKYLSAPLSPLLLRQFRLS